MMKMGHWVLLVVEIFFFFFWGCSGVFQYRQVSWEPQDQASLGRGGVHTGWSERRPVGVTPPGDCCFIHVGLAAIVTEGPRQTRTTAPDKPRCLWKKSLFVWTHTASETVKQMGCGGSGGRGGAKLGARRWLTAAKPLIRVQLDVTPSHSCNQLPVPLHKLDSICLFYKDPH